MAHLKKLFRILNRQNSYFTFKKEITYLRALVVAQLVKRLCSTPEVRRLNRVIGNKL